MKKIIIGFGFIIILSVVILVLVDSIIVKVLWENGVVYQEFKNLFNDIISKFWFGVGCVELIGKVFNNKVCEVNFYINGDIIFVIMNVDSVNFYNEFYIDYLYQLFKKVLFQNLIMKDDNVELKVVEWDFSYLIVIDGLNL